MDSSSLSTTYRSRKTLWVGLLSCLLLTTTQANAAEQCFHQPGTYGTLTVARSGPCGGDLNYGGILGLYMGSGTSSSSCTYTLTTPAGGVNPATLKVNVTAHSNVSGNKELATFAINGMPFPIITADIDNSFPTGGIDLLADANGALDSVSMAGGDGRGTVSMSRFNAVVTQLQITHTRVTGSPNGTIYRICADDTGAAIFAPPTVDTALTNESQPTITGTHDAANNTNLTVTVNNVTYVQGASTALAVNANGTWSLNLMTAGQTLPDNTYEVAVTSTNGTSTLTDNSQNELVVDTTPPVVTLDTPTDLSVTNDNTPTISGTIDDPTAPLVVTITDANGAIVETLTPTVNAQGSWTIDASLLPDGTYTVTASATDAATNTSTPVINTVTVDIVPPGVTLDAPSTGTQTNDNTPTISGTSEPNAAILVTVTDVNGAATTFNTTTDTQGNWTVDTSQLADGVYVAIATATDAAANVSTTLGNTFIVDTVAPALALNTPANMTITNSNTLTVSGTTEPGTIVAATITDANGAVVEVLTPTVDAQGNWTVDTSQLPEGTYTITASSTDTAGNITNAGPNSAVVDQTPPTVTLDTPADNSKTNDDTPTISGTTEPGAAVTAIITDANGAVVNTLTPTVDTQGNWTVDTSQLPEGTYNVVATATDAATNSATTPVLTFEIDLTPPALAIDAPTADQLLDTRDVTVSGTSDAGQDVTVNILDPNGNVIDTQIATADANGDWSIQTTGLLNGAYTARAQTSDAAGNAAQVEQTFTVDATEPIITIVTPADDATVAESKPAITGTSDTDATIVVIIKDSAGAEVETLNTTVDANGDWTVTPAQDLPEGTYTIEATATRPNNKMTTTTHTVTIDTTAPTTTITAPADGMVGNMNQPEITGTSEPGATVDVTITNVAGTIVFTGQTTADDQGNWSITPDAPLADDVYTIGAKGTDVANNEGAEITSDFTVDTNAPMVTITSPSNGETINDSTPTLSGVAEPGATVTIIVDGATIGIATADDQGAWTFELPEDSALAEGEHTIEATSTDEAGNVGTSGQLTITFETPKAPITITSPADGDDVAGPDITISGTGDPGEEITVTVNDSTETVTVDDDGNWTTTVTDIPDGQTTITAKSEDREATTTVTVTSAPDSTKYLITGGSCSSTGGGPSPAMWLLMLLGLMGLRRRKHN